MRGGTRAIKDPIGGSFDRLISPFSSILLLVIRFTLPTINTESTKDVLNLVTNNDLSTITNEFVRCSTLGNTVFQCIYKLLVSFNTIDVIKIYPGRYDLGQKDPIPVQM